MMSSPLASTVQGRFLKSWILGGSDTVEVEATDLAPPFVLGGMAGRDELTDEVQRSKNAQILVEQIPPGKLGMTGMNLIHGHFWSNRWEIFGF